MMCSECGKRPATHHTIKKINGDTIEQYLCSECQKKLGSSFFNMGFGGFGDLFSELSGIFGEPQARRRDSAVCSSCGTSVDEFLKTGFVGCPHCYNEFASTIMPVIRRIQGDASHVGKVPMGVENSVSAEYDRLKKELDKAVELEDYERASIIHSRMNQLKGG